ncbi:hypothetical protein PsorP6_000135 [Peronosclerospora sorghi]|uniref:Uncharacterized protein n=1 Tax=Peronosclerospora sorghi TaxID=230839 RepID=A0ACC0WUP4_9STRA|nr:hypothetical protein PsorP6_000135 [Peronosclerospora sorghi]
MCGGKRLSSHPGKRHIVTSQRVIQPSIAGFQMYLFMHCVTEDDSCIILERLVSPCWIPGSNCPEAFHDRSLELTDVVQIVLLAAVGVNRLQYAATGAAGASSCSVRDTKWFPLTNAKHNGDRSFGGTQERRNVILVPETG